MGGGGREMTGACRHTAQHLKAFLCWAGSWAKTQVMACFAHSTTCRALGEEGPSNLTNDS